MWVVSLSMSRSIQPEQERVLGGDPSKIRRAFKLRSPTCRSCFGDTQQLIANINRFVVLARSGWIQSLNPITMSRSEDGIPLRLPGLLENLYDRML